MQASSLQLESSAITRLKVEANKSFPKERAKERFDQFAEADLESTVEIAGDANDPHRYFVKLEMRLLGTEASPTPYAIDLEMIGIFTCGITDEEKRRQLVDINGPAVLYGSIRELVMQVTSRGPYPAVVLPTVSFVPPSVEVEPDGKPCQ
jgi:preprotein translocase subunit SecB